MSASVQPIYQYWKSFDLQQLQKNLDVTANDLATKQDESDVSRKQLVELSRDFKKNTPDVTRKQVAPLLKSFQQEIDSLSKRSKNAEAAFLLVYKSLIDVPDPCSVLEHALELQKKCYKMQDLDLENTKLRETLAEYNSEFAEVKNQEVTIKQLKEKIKDYEEKLETTAECRAKDKERELHIQFAEKEKQLQEMQLGVAKKLGEAEHRVNTLQISLDSTQSELFEMKTKHDEAASAKSDEVDMIMADLERANERAAAAENLQMQLSIGTENTLQAEQMQQTQNLEQAIDILKRSSLEVELAAKEKEISQLVEDVQRLQINVAKLRESNETKVSLLEEELTVKNAAYVLLEGRLNSQQDYEEISRELNVIKSMEFGVEKDDDVGKEGHGKSLEMLLLAKTRALQTENTTLKVSQNDLSVRYSMLQQQYNDAFNTIAEQKRLITQLEDDLRKVNTVSSMFRPEAEGEPSPGSAEMVAVAVKDMSVEKAVVSMDMLSATDSLLPIVQSQRERFRLRAQELEAQNVAQQQQVTLIQNEMDKLRLDNVKLYEKIKFLQSYPKSGSLAVDDTENRYSSQYEERLDPFSSFNKKERQRKYMNLKPYDKITLSMGRFIMGNKTARMVTFFYTLILHLLVFLVLYKMAYTQTTTRDLSSECHDKFAEHMLNVHGDAHDDHGHIH